MKSDCFSKYVSIETDCLSYFFHACVPDPATSRTLGTKYRGSGTMTLAFAHWRLHLTVSRRERIPRLDLCALPKRLRRDIGFEAFACHGATDWRFLK